VKPAAGISTLSAQAGVGTIAAHCLFLACTSRMRGVALEGTCVSISVICGPPPLLIPPILRSFIGAICIDA
jgi:hypothetical protein